MANLTNPTILFFILGVIAVPIKSDLSTPGHPVKFISLNLLFSFGFKGGQELAQFRRNIHYETYTIPTGAFSDIQRVIMTVGYNGFLMLLFRSGFFNWFVKPLSKVGQMALSNYLLQSLLCGLFFYGFGFGMFAKLQIHQNYLFFGVIWLICLIFSNIWLHFFQFGLAEWLWRSLTYWKKQEMKKQGSCIY